MLQTPELCRIAADGGCDHLPGGPSKWELKCVLTTEMGGLEPPDCPVHEGGLRSLPTKTADESCTHSETKICFASGVRRAYILRILRFIIVTKFVAASY